MSFTIRKVKDLEHAIELVKKANVTVTWDICFEKNLELSERFFNFYKPIVFIYKNENLIGTAYNKLGSPVVIGLDDTVTTSKYTKKQLNEIDINIRQIELF